MKSLKTGLGLAVIGATLAVVPGSPSVAVAVASGDQGSPTARLRDAADGSVRISTDSATGKVGFVSARGALADLLPDVAATTTAGAVAKVDAYFERFGAAFGATPEQLVQTDVQRDRYGWTVTYEQQYRGLPVFGSTLKATLDADGDLNAVAGYAAPGLDLSTDPRMSAEEAGRRAVAFVKADPPTSEDGEPADTSAVRVVDNELEVYRLGALRGEPGEAVLAYVVEVSDREHVRDMVFIDADTGKPVNRYSMITEALDRELQEATGTAQAPVLTTVWKEGDPFPGDLNQDQQNLVNSSGESYWMFQNTFGRDSYDGEGAKRITVNNDPRINCPNANWNGTTTNYCNGVTSDDVVSHEWGHAYTEYTSGLIYQYQSGALNESYSDVWGETLDLLNDREDEGEVFGTKRPDGECDPTAPPKLQMQILSPASVAGACTAVAAGFSEEFTTTPIEADVVVAVDPADTTGPSTTDGCTAFTNAAAVAGNAAYVDRGTCTFQVKIDNAVAAGATGLVIGNNAAGLPPSPAGTAPEGFYGVAVTQADGTRFKSAGTARVRVQAEDVTARTDSTRWLVGEKSEAFGGAIRDMWTPTCYGNPGKVSDAEYNCDPLLTDNGGVHGNSGIPNHAYALVVDGGSYNGETITGIGLDKAANIWWRAQTSYLSPASDFTDAADAFEQSCTDLVGQPINEVTITPDTAPEQAEPITAADCTSVARTMVATEMRKDPVQCNFQPLLAPGELSACGAGTTTETVVLDDFEDGLAGWTPGQVLATGATEGFPWEAATGTAEAPLPEGHAGTVAYAPDPDEGTCSPGVDDISSADSITSPEYTVPAGRTPRVTVDHYVATEAGYDGGNVKVQLNGGAFTTVPASAYLFNPYNATMATSATNTSPLAGQPGFTGTDGGEVTGSWGQSTISLAKLGAKAGDKVKIRFDFGRDGCGGNDGWYLDDLVLTVCKDAPTITATHEPEPSTYGEASTVEVEAPTAATGTVTLSVGGRTVGEADLADGSASIPVPAATPAGTTTWTVSYGGDDAFGASETPVTVTVARARTTTRVSGVPSQLEAGRRAVVRVTVASAAGTPAGRVTLKRAGKAFGSAVLKNGRAVVRTAKLQPGRYVLRAAYAGSRNLAPSTSAPVTVRVTR